MKKALLVMALVSTASYATYRYVSGGSSATVAHDDSLVQDRLWIDHIPKNDRDKIQLFVALTEQPAGIFLPPCCVATSIPPGPEILTSRSESPDQVARPARYWGVPWGSTFTLATFAFVAVPPLPSVAVTETV